MGCALFRPLETRGPLSSPAEDQAPAAERPTQPSKSESARVTQQVPGTIPQPAEATTGQKLGSSQAGDTSSSLEPEDEAEDLEESEATFDVPVVTNYHVVSFIKYFQGPKREWMKTTMQRAGRYLPKMQSIFREEGLPADLVYLALIESGCNPYAHSRAGAEGIWQFIPATGIRYGLRINWWIDERRDPEKATRAAARYLKDLYAQFGDWYLAAAAYNYGEMNVQRAMQRYSVNNFWHLSRLQCLPTETQEYVPKYLAAMMIAKEPEKYGFGFIRPEEPVIYDTVKVPYRADLHNIADACDTEHHVLVGLNPELRQGCTPPQFEGYKLKVPLGKEYTLLQNFSSVAPLKPAPAYHKYRVRRGETVARIAQRYGVSADSIMKTNGLKSASQIRHRRTLLIPLAVKDKGANENRARFAKSGRRESNSAEQSPGNGYSKVIHEVKAGDTLWSISKRYGIGLASIQKWNKDLNLKDLAPGQSLVLWVHKNARIIQVANAQANSLGNQQLEIVYTIRAGDTLSSIARRYQVTVNDILSWNKISPRKRLRPGDQLRLFPSVRVDAYHGELPPKAVDD